MPREFTSFRSIGTQGAFHLAASFWISVLLSICHITDVNAMIPAVPKLNQSIKIEAGPRHMHAGYCEDGYACGEQEPPVQYHARNDTYDDRYDKGWYARPERNRAHTVTECEEGYEIVEVYPVPEPYHSEPYRNERCGVRCWYRRLTSGYCGRGCEYYLYRLHKSRWACRSRY